MAMRTVQVQRFTLQSKKAFGEVLAAIDGQIGHPQMEGFRAAMGKARSADDMKSIVDAAVGPAGLIEFTRFDFGDILQKDGVAGAKSVRIVAGNPLIMKEMVKHVPDAGSYAR